MAKKTVIIDNSLDGAAAGAAFLLANPDAGVFISSSYSLPSRLANLPEWGRDITETTILGVGCRRSGAELADAMRALSATGVSISWISHGRGYPEHEFAVEGLCTLMREPDSTTLTHAVISSLGLSEDLRAAFLLAIAEAGRIEKLKDRGQKTMAELAVASMYRFFQLGDRDAYPAAVRKMAGLDQMTDDDSALLTRFRALGHITGPDGSSACIKEVRNLVRLYGPLDSLHVLVLGETGTGKERVARLLHQESRRAAKHFIAVNCSTLSNSDLLESKLFGHVKGAFTGAVADRSGLLEDADKGTLFLDEIGEMPLETQAKLLRVIEDGTFNRLGANQELKVNVRVVAATNRNLAGMVREGSFRIDLYYRLRELVIRMPPLRDRLCDLGQIVGTVRRFLAEEHGRKFPDLGENQYELLRSYSWPGNVRQLKNVLHRSYLLGVDQHLARAVEEERAEGLDELLNLPSSKAAEVAAVPPVYEDGRAVGTADTSEPETLRVAMRKHAMAALAACGGNLARTAKVLDISVNTLKKLRDESAVD